MERNINIKYLGYEIKRNLKVIAIISIVIAILFTIYSYFDAQQKKESQKYGAYGELNVVYHYDQFISTMVNDSIEIGDISGLTLPIITSNELLTNVLNDADITNLGLTKDDIRSMVYPISKNGGQVIKISTVASDSEMAELLCKKVIQEAYKTYSAKDYEVYIQREVEPMGVVKINEKDEGVPGEKTVYVTAASETRISLEYLIKKIVTGLLFGLVISIICMFVLFVLKDRIIYGEQICEGTGIEILSNGCCKEELWTVYAKMMSNDDGMFGMLALSDLKKNYPEELVKFLNETGKNTILVEIVDQINAENNIYTVENNKAKIGYNTLFNKENMYEVFNSLKKRYEYILLTNKEIGKCSIINVVHEYAKEIIIAFEPNSVTVKELGTIKEKIECSNARIIGCIFNEENKR